MWFEANVERVREVANMFKIQYFISYTDGKNCFVWIADHKIQECNTPGMLMRCGNLRHISFGFEYMSDEENGEISLYRDVFGNFFAGVQVAGKVELIELKVCHGAKSRNVFADFPFTEKWKVLMDDGTIIDVDYVGNAQLRNGNIVEFDKNFSGAVRIAYEHYCIPSNTDLIWA